MQTLGRRGKVVTLRFQTCVARRPPEHFKKRAGDAAIRQRDGALLSRDKRKWLGDFAGILLRRTCYLVEAASSLRNG
jgi:hypothetical protein